MGVMVRLLVATHLQDWRSHWTSDGSDGAFACRNAPYKIGDRTEWREIPDQVELAPGVTIDIPKQKLWVPDK